MEDLAGPFRVTRDLEGVLRVVVTSVVESFVAVPWRPKDQIIHVAVFFNLMSGGFCAYMYGTCSCHLTDPTASWCLR